MGQGAEFTAVLQQEADLTAGHGVLRTTGLLAVSAQDPDEFQLAVADIEHAAIQASFGTRWLRGQQAQAFLAAALTLCRPFRVTSIDILATAEHDVLPSERSGRTTELLGDVAEPDLRANGNKPVIVAIDQLDGEVVPRDSRRARPM